MKPLDLLQQSLHKPVLVELRGGRSIRGTLESFDQHLNLLLSSAEEHDAKGESPTPRPGVTLVRGDSVIFISP
jgi:small nuclear ribonucleoprotein